MSGPPSDSGEQPPVRRIHFWQHARAVRHIWRAYAPGVDVLVDQLRATGPIVRFALINLVMPLYFAREQGWSIPGDPDKRGTMAAIMYLRRQHRQGIRVLHIDDISVDADYRRRGLAERLMSLAETLARHEGYSFLKLAVTVTNAPAVTLYRRLGYQDQHHCFFTCDPSTVAAGAPSAIVVKLRRVQGSQALEAQRRFYRMELDASVPAAEVMAVYYPWRDRGVGMHRYTIEHQGQPVGYGDALRRGGQWSLRVSLQPDLWGSVVEREVIRRLAGVVMGKGTRGAATLFRLHLASAAHHEALSAGSPSLASELGLTEQHSGQMIMVKALAGAL